jgi:predicted DNA-binding protein
VKPKQTRGTGQKPKGQAIRASISFSHEVYETLEGIAKKKKVSMAWVVREAVDDYIEAKWPLFLQRGLKES